MLLTAAGCTGDPLHMMPEAASLEAGEIDELTYLVFWITAVTFVLVQGLLVVFLVKYRRRAGVRATHTHGNHTVELIWTIAPALILVFLALYQFGLWTDLKAATPQDNKDAVQVQVMAKQFEWFFRYPGADGVFETKDDKITSGEMVVPVGRPVNITMRSMDVLHSFYLPNFRIKTDALPGSDVNIWFRPTKLSKDRVHPSTGEPMMTRPTPTGPAQRVHFWDIVCAELCGSGHTTMAARLFVVEQADYDKWINGEATDAVTTTLAPYYADDEKAAFHYWRRQDEKRRVPAPPKHIREPFGEDQKGTADEGGEEEDF